MSILKQGEINAIMNNFEVVENEGKLEGRIGNNSIHLTSSHEHRVSLRTNGLVVYGVYYHGEQKIRFTHDFMRYPKPFVKCDDYVELKQVVLNAWKKTFDAKAQAKLNEVKVIVQQILKQQEKTLAKHNAQEPQVAQTKNKTIETKIEKKEVKEMKNTTTNTNKLHVMKIAHIIRKELKLEGHYHAQMKIAMNLAWKVKKGFLSLEDLIAGEEVGPEVKEEVNTNNSTAAQATHTYNAADATKEPVVKEPVVSTDFTYRIYLKSMKNGIAEFFMRRSDGAERPFYKTKVRGLVDLDKQFAKVLGTALQKCYDNTTLEYYGQYTYLTFCNTEGLREYAGQRNITLSQGVAPSGDVA